MNDIFNHNNEILVCWTGKFMPAITTKDARFPWFDLKKYIYVLRGSTTSILKPRH